MRTIPSPTQKRPKSPTHGCPDGLLAYSSFCGPVWQIGDAQSWLMKTDSASSICLEKESHAVGAPGVAGHTVSSLGRPDRGSGGHASATSAAVLRAGPIPGHVSSS